MQLTFEDKPIDQLAIELIQAYEPPEGYYLGFSGGKDSVVIFHLAKRAQVKVRPCYSVSPIDPPELWQFIKDFYPEVQWEYYAKGFFSKHFMRHGLPLRNRRWCCEIIKEAGGSGFVKILGMRAAESNNRKSYKCFENHGKKRGDWLLPILNWSNSDVWQYIAENRLRVCPLYKLGYKRLGCLLCPYSNKDEIKIVINKYPKIVSAYINASERYIKSRKLKNDKKLTFQTGKEYFNWWIAR